MTACSKYFQNIVAKNHKDIYEIRIPVKANQVNQNNFS